ncbi:hypothetical protein ABPG75_002014 [Micractinium tetrahymenae]
MSNRLLSSLSAPGCTALPPSLPWMLSCRNHVLQVRSALTHALPLPNQGLSRWRPPAVHRLHFSTTPSPPSRPHHARHARLHYPLTLPAGRRAARGRAAVPAAPPVGGRRPARGGQPAARLCRRAGAARWRGHGHDARHPHVHLWRAQAAGGELREGGGRLTPPHPERDAGAGAGPQRAAAVCARRLQGDGTAVERRQEQRDGCAAGKRGRAGCRPCCGGFWVHPTPRLPQWLKAGGHPAPPMRSVNPHMVSVTRFLRIPSDWDGDWLCHATYEREGSLHGASVVPVEGGLWQVYAFGTNGTTPPGDEQDFMAFLRGLPDPQIYEAMKRAEPLTPLIKFGVGPAFQRRWDQIRMPGGVVAVTDCVQGANPVYAQGIAAAALGIVSLDSVLSAAVADAGADREAQRAALHGVGPAFHAGLPAVLEGAWASSTAEDLRHPRTEVEGGLLRPPPLLDAYMSALNEVCAQDVKAHEIMLGMVHLLRPPAHVFHPRLLAGAALQSMRRASKVAAATIADRRYASRPKPQAMGTAVSMLRC